MKKYTFEVIENDKGELSFRSKVDGFHGFEVLGFLDWKRDDIMRQIRKDIEPTIVSREVVDD